MGILARRVGRGSALFSSMMTIKKAVHFPSPDAKLGRFYLLFNRISLLQKLHHTLYLFFTRIARDILGTLTLSHLWRPSLERNCL